MNQDIAEIRHNRNNNAAKGPRSYLLCYLYGFTRTLPQVSYDSLTSAMRTNTPTTTKKCSTRCQHWEMGKISTVASRPNHVVVCTQTHFLMILPLFLPYQICVHITTAYMYLEVIARFVAQFTSYILFYNMYEVRIGDFRTVHQTHLSIPSRPP